ncbi:MAG: response regulator transcription factor [Acidobacteriota bacterium]|nr:response regulator transcription factor [Acidobacteriota bacterium]
MNTRIIIADDHALILEGLRRIVEDCCELVTTATDGQMLVRVAAELKPELILLDISMPVLNGIEADRQILAADPKIRLIFLSMHADLDYVREAFRIGAAGYVLKRAAVSELNAAIREVMAGGHYLSPLITKETVSFLLKESTLPGLFGRELTQRQREVLQLVAEGKAAKEISATLGISTKTVEFHKTSIMDTLGLRTIAELTRYAISQGIVAK